MLEEVLLGDIEIKFLKGETNQTANGDITDYTIPSALKELKGIWVAKFEASRSDASASSSGSSNAIKIQAGVQSWRRININDIYINCLNYNRTLNSHMMRNTEWGTVAYLAQSSYGKNEEIWINNSSNFITGSAGNSVSAATDVGTDTDYTSSQGVKASTTGNVYGVYDMSGGANEYVAAYVDNKYENDVQNSSLANDSKFSDVYKCYATYSGADTRKQDYNSSIKYGDAIYETSATYTGNFSWNSDYSSFPGIESLFFERGGDYNSGTKAGIFAFSSSNGNQSDSGFRLVLIP